MIKVQRAKISQSKVPLRMDRSRSDAWGYMELFGDYPRGQYPVRVDQRSVYGLPAISRGVDMVSNGVATMMRGADVLRNGNIVASPAIVKRPNVMMGTFEFWRLVVAHLMMHGNFVGITTAFGGDGYPTQVVPIDPRAVMLHTHTGNLIYEIDNEFYGWDEVVHIRANGDDGAGLWGLGIIGRFAKELEVALYEQNTGVDNYKTASVPTGIRTLEADKVDAETAAAVKTQWFDSFQGGRRVPAVMGKKMTYTPITGWAPKDMEWVEGRKLTIAECALICGLDPADLSAGIGGSSITYQTLNARQLARISDSYAPWLNLIEEAWSDLLPGGQIVRGNPEALLRTSTTERYALHKEALAGKPWRTVNEIREIENLPPIEGGDELVASSPVDPATSPVEATNEQFAVTA